MDFQRIEYCLCVAKHMNFTRAAEEKFITQPTMTQQINALEKELGVRLFVRDKHSVALTPAGTIFVNEAQDILQKYNKMLVNIRSAQVQFTDTVIVGYDGFLAPNAIQTIIKKSHEKNSEVHIHLYKNLLAELARSLRQEYCDVIFTSEFEVGNSSEFEVERLFSSSPCIFLSKTHPLANKKYVTQQDIAGEFIYLASSAIEADVLHQGTTILIQAGVVETTVDAKRICANPEVIFPMLETGQGVFPAPSCLHHSFEETITKVPLHAGVKDLPVVMVWRKNSKNPALAEFLQVVRDYPWEDFECDII